MGNITINVWDNIASFNDFLWATVDYDSRQIIITRDAVEGDNDSERES